MVDDGKYTYQLRMVDLDGSESYSNFVEVYRGSELNKLRLDQNFPNPMLMGNEAGVTQTRFKFYLPTEDHVKLKIFSAVGQLVYSVVDERLPQGQHDKFWDGRDAQGISVSAGTYFYVLETSTGEQLWNKLVVIE
jgi:hypothetical protein